MTESLQRVVGLWGAVGMGLGSILGTGVFVSLAIGAGIGGASVVLATALAALVATFNGLSSAQLAAAHPVSGGTYEYGYHFLRPAVGFSAGVMFLVAKSASAATAALGSAGALLELVGGGVDPLIRSGLAAAIVLGLTALVASGLRRSNTVNLVIVGLTILTLLTFVIGGLSTGPTLDVSGWAPDTPATLLSTTALMFVAYTGYGRIATLGEEVREPARTIPRAIVTTLVVSMVLYVSVAATATLVVGADAFAAAARTAAPLQVVAQQIGAPVAWAVALGALTAMTGVLLNLVLGLSRVALAMARRHDLPGGLALVDATSQSPVRAVWAVGLFVTALVLIGDVRTTWTFSAFTVLVYYSITNLAALALPKEHLRFPRILAALGLASCAGLAAFVPWQVAIVGVGILAVALLARQLLGPRAG